MEPLYRDFTVCKNCGASCYLNNSYCEDCANELFEAECGINAQLIEENKILAKALEMAVADKCKFENAYISNVLDMPNGEIAVPKKEQWYLEQAEKEMRGE